MKKIQAGCVGGSGDWNGGARIGSDIGPGSHHLGTTAIAATSASIICTAATIDAANAKPDGVTLRGIRFNPVPGSQE